MIAPAAVPPTILAVSRPFSLWPFWLMRALIAIVLPSATTSCVKSILSAGTAPILLLPEVTSVIEPRMRRARRATTRPPTTRSEASRASTGLADRAVLVE